MARLKEFELPTIKLNDNNVEVPTVSKATPEIMVNFLYYYYCWRVVSEVHKLGWILVHRVCGFLNMQPPIKVKLN
jgi:hypothetical protein